MENQKKQSQKVLVTGATGKIGSLVLDNLIKLGIATRASSRNPETAVIANDVELVELNFSKADTIRKALNGINKVFLYAHGDDLQAFIEQAKNAGIGHIVLLSSSSVLSGNTDNFLVKRHLTVEQAIRESEIPFTFLRPGAFASNTLMWRQQIKNGNKVRFAYPTAETAPIHEADIAAVAAKVLSSPGFEGQSPLLTGPESLTQLRQLELIGNATGQNLIFEEMQPDEALALMSKNMPVEYASVLLNVMKGRVGITAQVSPAVGQITGKPATPFETWAKENIKQFLPER